MGNRDSTSNQNDHTAEIQEAIAEMKALLEEVFNHQEKCYEAFSPTSNQNEIED